MKTRPAPSTVALSARIAAMQRQGFTAPNIIRTLHLTPAQVVEYRLSPTPNPSVPADQSSNPS